MTSISRFGCAAAIIAMTMCSPAGAQVVGSYDNFDAFNDTGREAEGFEIDVEDVAPNALTREFPSNFSQPWLIRYGLPTIAAYDWTSKAPDAEHSYDAGHKGVLITWAAKYVAGKWVAPQGANRAAPGPSGNATPYNAHPTLTAGESCWWYGLGAAYPKSGCEHFGISFAGGIQPGRITYHWKLPDATNTRLVNSALEASIPPSPQLAVAPPVVGQLPVVVAVARAPQDIGGDPYVPADANPQFGDAYWLKTTTTYGNNRALLENLQVKLLKQVKTTKVVTWTLLQRSPGVGAKAGTPERELVENDAFANAKVVQVTKQYQYFKYTGAYDSETHQTVCDVFYATQADAAAGGATVQTGCQDANSNDTPYTKDYWTIDPVTNLPIFVAKGNLGDYIGAHVNAYNVK